MEEKRACPYCGVVLDPVPTRSRKCPDCEEKIVLRTDSPTKKKLLLTEIEASEFDEKKKVKSSRNKVLRNLWFLDDAEKEYNAMEVELGAGFKPGDIFWALANRQRLELELNPSKNAKEISQISFTMARHLLDEGKSKAHVQQLQAESAYWDLVHHQIQFASMKLGANAVVKTDTCCDECSKLEGEEYDLDELVANCLADRAEGRPETSSCPLPQARCELQWCTCHFTVKSDSAKKSRVLFSPVDAEEDGAKQAGCLIQIIILAVMGVFLIIVSSIFGFVAGLFTTIPLYLFLTFFSMTVNLE